MACHCYIAKQAHDCEAACSILLNIFKPLTEILTHLPAFSAAPVLVMQISQPFKKKMMEWCREKLLFNQLFEQTIYCQILHTVWIISLVRDWKRKLKLITPGSEGVKNNLLRLVLHANYISGFLSRAWPQQFIVLGNNCSVDELKVSTL